MDTPSPYHYLHQRNILTYGSLLAGLVALESDQVDVVTDEALGRVLDPHMGDMRSG